MLGSYAISCAISHTILWYVISHTHDDDITYHLYAISYIRDGDIACCDIVCDIECDIACLRYRLQYRICDIAIPDIRYRIPNCDISYIYAISPWSTFQMSPLIQPLIHH